MTTKVALGPIFKRVLAQFDTHAEFARQLGLGEAGGVGSKQALHWWVTKIGYIPATYALRVSTLVGGKITVLELLNEAEVMGKRQRALKEARRELAAQQTPPGES